MTDLNRVVDPDASWALHSAEALTEDGALVGQGDHQGVSTAYRLQIDAIESASLLRGERIGRPEPWTLDYSAKEDRLSGSFRTEALAPGKHVARSRIVLSGPDGKQYAEEESTAVTAQFNYTFPEDAPGGTYPVEWQGYNAEGAQEAVFGDAQGHGAEGRAGEGFGEVFTLGQAGLAGGAEGVRIVGWAVAGAAGHSADRGQKLGQGPGRGGIA